MVGAEIIFSRRAFGPSQDARILSSFVGLVAGVTPLVVINPTSGLGWIITIVSCASLARSLQVRVERTGDCLRVVNFWKTHVVSLTEPAVIKFVGLAEGWPIAQHLRVAFPTRKGISLTAFTARKNPFSSSIPKSLQEIAELLCTKELRFEG